MKVTLHTVAERASVSIATASRALNGLPVSPVNKERVDRAVSELGYIANDAARTLRRDRTMTMGLIFSDLGNTLGIDLVDSLAESIEGEGYSLLIATARGDAERYDLLMRRFLEQRADALFCIRPTGHGTFLDRYAEESVPVMALFGGRGRFADLPTVSPSLAEAAAALAEHLVGRGHRRVAVLENVLTNRAQPVTEALARRGVDVAPLEVTESGGVRDALAGLLAGADRPTAVVARDPAVRGVLSACASLGIDVPDDLAVVAICDRPAAAHFAQRDISSVTVDPHRMGSAAAAAMLGWLGGSRPPQQVRVSTATFTVRASSQGGTSDTQQRQGGAR